jgi:hypothetical protein
MADRKKDRKKQSGPPGLGLLGGSKKTQKKKKVQLKL